MNINLIVDLAYALDFLLILEIKSNKLKNKSSLKNFHNHRKHIYSQIDDSLLKMILISQEYKDLYKINEEIWNTLNLIKTNKISGRQINELNCKRWILKNKLQSKFFNKKISEQKDYLDLQSNVK